MKYVLLFVETERFDKDWDAMSEADRDRASGLVYKWMADHADKIRGGSKLQSASTTTTVRLDDGREPVITNGPSVELAELDALAEALELTANPAEQALLRHRIAWGEDAD